MARDASRQAYNEINQKIKSKGAAASFFPSFADRMSDSVARCSIRRERAATLARPARVKTLLRHESGRKTEAKEKNSTRGRGRGEITGK